MEFSPLRSFFHETHNNHNHLTHSGSAGRHFRSCHSEGFSTATYPLVCIAPKESAPTWLDVTKKSFFEKKKNVCLLK